LVVRRFLAFSVKHTILILFLLAALAGCGPDQSEEQRKRAERAEHALAQSESTNSVLLVVLVVVVVTAVVVARQLHKKRPIVRKVIKQEVVQQVVNKQVVVRTPAHEIVADSFVIDAKNVVHGSSQGQLPSLLILVGLLLDLHKRNISYKCFFDANTYYAFKDAQRLDDGRAYRALCREFRDHFIEVPGGNRADDLILDWAHRHGTPIITNDRYRDYFDKYSWLENGSKRRVSFAVHSGIIQIYPLGIEAPIPADLAAAVTELRNALKPQLPGNA